MTLTRRVLRAARLQLWLVTGAGKAEPVARMLDGDRSLPAGAVIVPGARVVLDEAAWGSRV